MEANDNLKNQDTNEDANMLRQMPTVNQNFGLTKAQFEAMILQLKGGDESLFERIFLNQFEDCKLYLIKTFNCTPELAYDVTMDTLLEFRKKIFMDKIAYGNLRYLFTRMASNNYVDLKKKGIKYEDTFIEHQAESDELDDSFSLLNNAWDKLDEADKSLLDDFYYKDIPLIKIAEKQNKNDSTIRKQKQRAVEKLREIFFNCYNNQ